MRVLTIGSDRNVFNATSESAKRQAAYGAHFDAFDIIVFTLDSEQRSPQTPSTTMHVYPTASLSRATYGFGAFTRAMRLPKPDVVSVQDPFEAGLIGLVISFFRGSALYVQVHTDFLAPNFRKGILNRVRRVIAGIVLRRATRIRTVSVRIKESIEKAYRPKASISVLPIFTDVDRFRHAHAGALEGRFSKFKTKLLIVGRLEAEKNTALAIESLAKIKMHDACLIIVGTGSQKEKLEALVKRYNLTERVFFEGWQDPAPYYALASLVLVPSKYEGYGNVIIEALAAGKPVLSTDVGVAHEAGAFITSLENFSAAISAWAEGGRRAGELRNYPYKSFEEYVEAYCADIAAAKR